MSDDQHTWEHFKHLDELDPYANYPYGDDGAEDVDELLRRYHIERDDYEGYGSEVER